MDNSESGYWLSYGGGVNSTALAVLLIEGLLPKYEPFRIVFADTWTERDVTYQYITEVFMPYLARHGQLLEIVQPSEGVLRFWQMKSLTGSRTIRRCTQEAKRMPIKKYTGDGEMLIGIDAGEKHRAVDYPHRHYPLVLLGIDRTGCIEIIQRARLPVPQKSGCWCCPFMRVGEVMELAKHEPIKFAKIERLEAAANLKHPGSILRTQWGDKPASYWRERAIAQGVLPLMYDIEMPCECFDGCDSSEKAGVL